MASPDELFVSQAGVQTLVTRYERWRTEFVDKVATERGAITGELETALRGKTAVAYLAMLDDFVRDFNRFIDAEITQLRMTLTQSAEKISAVDAELGAIIAGMAKG